jgi:hypothetical protein
MGLFNLFQLSGQILLDSGEALTGLNNMENAATRTGAVFKKIGGGISSAGKSLSTFVTLPVLAAMGASVKLASDMNETVSKTSVVFKKGAKDVIDWSGKTLKNIGLAKGTALDMAAVYGDMGTAMGLSGNQAKNMSMNMVDLTGDMASFKNMRPDEIHVALAGVYTGETEALKRLGIIMTVNNLQEYAKQQGIKKTYKEMTQAEKIQLRYNYVMKSSKNSVGDFIRTQDSAANQTRIFTESIKEAGAKFGAILLPFVTKGLNILNSLMDRLSKLNPHMQKVVVLVALIAAGIGPLLIVIGGLITAIGTVITFIGGLTVPIAAVIVGLSAFVLYWGSLISILGVLVVKAGLVKMAINGVKNIVNIFSNILKGNTKDAINLLISKFGMSKKEAEKFVKTVQDLKSKIIIFGNTVKEKAKMAFDYLVSKLKVAGTWVYNHRKEIIKAIETFIKLASTVVSAATKVLNAAAKFVQFGVKVASACKMAVKATINMVTDIAGKIGGLAKKAYTWGKNLISSFISGIKAKIPSIKSTLGKIGNTVKDFIGWSSPTKEGAGKHSDKWGPNLMNMFTKGLISGKGNLKNAMTDISNSLEFGTMKNLSIPGINTGNINTGNQNKLYEKVALIINNPKFFNQQDIDKMMNPVVARLQTTLGNKR